MNLGACCVSIFFFFSGYGLTYNLTRKGSTYLSGFFGKRLKRVILPLITAYVIALTVYPILKGPVDIKTVMTTLLWGGPYLKFSWYVTEIIVIYIIFYLIMRIKATYECRIFILSVSVLLLACILFILKQPIWYIESLPCFIIGVYYQRFELSIVNRFNVASIILLIVIWGCIWFFTWQWNTYVAQYIPEYRYALIATIVSNISFVFLVINLLLIISTTPHYVIIHSFYEIYLIQNVAMMIASVVSDNFITYWSISMGISVISGYILYMINDKIAIGLKKI